MDHYHIFLGFLLISITTQVHSSHVSGLESLYANGKKEILTSLHEHWDNATIFLSTIKTEFESLCDNCKIDCFRLAQSASVQTMNNISDNFHECQFNAQYDYENFALSLVLGFGSSFNVQLHFENNYALSNSLKSIDNYVMSQNKTIFGYYKKMLDIFYRYNLVYFESLERCEVIFTYKTNETLFETKNQFNKCAEKHKIDRKPLKTPIKIKNQENNSTNSSKTREIPYLNWYNNEKEILQIARMKSHRVIEDIKLNATANFTNTLTEAYNQNDKKDIGCCFVIPKKQIDAAMVMTKNKIDNCFENKTFQFESFAALILKDNDVQEILHICYGGNPQDIITCLEAMRINTTKYEEIYIKVLNKWKENYKLLPFVVHDCLYSLIGSFFQLVAFLNNHLQLCIKKQSAYYDCLDVPFYFPDSNNQTYLDKSIKTINAILTKF